MRVLKVLDQTLEPKTFLVGEGITLADIAVVTAVLLPFKYVRMWPYRFDIAADFSVGQREVLLCQPFVLLS